MTTELAHLLYIRWATIEMARGITTGKVRHGQVKRCRDWRRHAIKEYLRRLDVQFRTDAVQ